MFVTIYDNRTCEFIVTIKNAAGAAVILDVIGTNDNVRCKIGSNSSTPSLELESNADTPNGSGIVINPTQAGGTQGQVTVTINQEDIRTSLFPGSFDIEVDVVDSSDGSLIKHAEKGVLVVHRTQAGETDL